ncbi:titin-like [Mya arenaria]|uniref:titin-like n=1 Tax=Mya arenaria TaxID=6604 RepID=UPI0022E93264|nr:titin-like [Mya arenaria]
MAVVTCLLLVMCAVVIVCVLVNNQRNAGDVTRTKPMKVRRPRKGILKKKPQHEVKPPDEQPTRTCCGAMFCRGQTKEPERPEAPFGLDVQNPSSSEVTLLWNAPNASRSAVVVEGFQVYRRHQGKDDWRKVAKVGVESLEFRITGLAPNRKYIFGVACLSKDAESRIIESSPITLKKDPIRPGAPSELEIVSKTSNSITLSWKPPNKAGYSRIHTYYLLMRELDKGVSWKLVAKLQAFDRYMDYRVTGLHPSNPYRFRVNAENAVAIGPSAETVTVETAEIEPERPSPPEGPIKFARISHKSITLSWRPPLEDGGKPITGYAVEFREKESSRWKKAGVSEPDRMRHTVNMLPEDVFFYFRVVAMNDVGNSDPLVGGKVKTKLLEIPLSRRSSFRIPSRAEDTRESRNTTARSRPSHVSGNDVHLDLHPDDDVTAQSPFVPQSDFFNMHDIGNISTRHSENKTRHSQYSPLPKMRANFTNGYIISSTRSNNTPRKKTKNLNRHANADYEDIDRSKNENATNNKHDDYNDKDDPVDRFSYTTNDRGGRDIGRDADGGGRSIGWEADGRVRVADGPFDYRHTDDDMRNYQSPVPRHSGHLIGTSPSVHSSQQDTARSYRAGYQLPNPSNVAYSQGRY